MRKIVMYTYLVSILLVSVTGLNTKNDKPQISEPFEKNIELMSTIDINRIDVSNCYFYDEQGYATVSVEFSWTNAPIGDSIVLEVPGKILRYAFIDLPIYDVDDVFITDIALNSPQVIAFELPADNTNNQVNLRFSSVPATQATDTFDLPGNCPFLFCGDDTTRLSGMAFLDLNADGIRQFGETSGYEGMRVNLFECFTFMDHEPLMTTTTNASGEYTFTGLETDLEYKVIFEFPDGASLINTSGEGEINEMIQFATVPNCGINVSVSDNGLFCQENPDVALACFVHGDPLPNTKNDNEVLLSVPYSTSLDDNSGKKIMANASEGGSIWGIAWDGGNQATYTSAVLRRHSAMGPLGLCGIYKKEANKNLEEWIDLSFGGTYDFGEIPGNIDRGLSENPRDPSVDSIVFPLFGRVGIGGIDIDPFGEYLFACNLKDKHLYQLEMDADNDPNTKPTSDDITRIPIPDICDPTTGESRPWAVKVFDNHVYVGAVCDAEISQNRSDMRGYIFIYSLLTHQWLDKPAIDFPLTYPKGAPATHISPFQECGLWNPWNDDYDMWCKADVTGFGRTFNYSYPMPIISDLEFDVDGTLVLALMDRSAFMTGNEDYDPRGEIFMKSVSASGDILRAMKFKDVYVLENNGISGPNKGLLSNNRQGPGFGEFFDDNYHVPDSSLIHAELALGATAILPASQQMIYNAVDPIDYTDFKFAAGLRWHSTANGEFQKGYIAYQSAVLPSFAKSAGLGDIELQCAKSSDISIGNYVWVDLDRDGVQDPCEPPAVGINVSLLDKNGTEITTIQTDSIGRYYFRSKNIPELRPNTEYDIVFATYGQYDADLRVTVADIGKVLPTLPNEEFFAYGDRMDSDATITHFPSDHEYYTFPAIGIRTPDEGNIDLTFDFGLSFYDYAVKNIIINEKPLPYLDGEEITYEIVTYNFGGLPGYNVETSCYLNNGMRFIPPNQLPIQKSKKGNRKNAIVNEGWTLVGDSLLYITKDSILQGETDTVFLTLEVTNGYGPESWNLQTEVSEAYNIIGESISDIELDSKLDRNQYNNGGSLYRSPADNFLFGDGTATEINGNRITDQDNVDPAIARILDVALKIYPDPEFISYDSVKYYIVTENQGSFPIDSLTVSLTHSDAYCFDSSINPEWTEGDTTNVHSLTVGALDMLETDTVCIYFKAVSGQTIGDWTVEAEISDVAGLGRESLKGFEIDSELNNDFSDNVGGIVDSPADDYLLGFGDALGPDSVAITDQDNADKAYFLPTDMALRLTLDPAFGGVSVSIGDTVKYIIDIFNQGRDTITNVGVINYVQPCLKFVSALNPSFTESISGFSTLYTDTLYPLQKGQIGISLIVEPGAECEYINEAEITSFQHIDGTDLSDKDLDSTPDSIYSNDPVITDELGRYELDSLDPCNNFIIVHDEDDHDIAPIPKYDLALKNVILTQPQKYGDTVCYVVTVYNQGNQPVRSIDVINHFADGLTFDTDLNEDWTPVSDDAFVYTYEPLLFEGDSIEIPLKAIIHSAIPDSLAYLSIAEIMSMYNMAGELMNGADLDSDPDDNANNDVGGIPYTVTDDHIYDDRLDTNMDDIIDEDDHDPAILSVLDLSITKEVVEERVYKIGENVEYLMTIRNEGSDVTTGFSVVDYLPIGLSFTPENNKGWNLDTEGNPVYHSAVVLRPGEISEIIINLRVNRDAAILDDPIITNVVEIFDHANSQQVYSSDFDSEPDKNAENDIAIDSITGVMTIEDDLDLAPITIEKVDPRGVIYCDATGGLITGGNITITRLQDGQVITPRFAVENNTDTLDGRNGIYEFFVDVGLILGNIDTFQINYSHPLSLPVSSICTPVDPVLNAEGMGTNGSYILGDTNIVNGALSDFTCSNNRYSTQFVLTPFTPLIIGNNIPITCNALGGIVCADQDTNATVDNNETLLQGRMALLYSCADTINPIDTSSTNSGGRWLFSGLTDSCYRVQVLQDQNFVNYPNSNFSAEGWSTPKVLTNGTQELTNDFCFPILNCDSIFCQPNINITLPDACDYRLQSNVMLQGIIPRRDFIEFSYIDDHGVQITTDIIPREYVGRCIDVVSTTVFTCSFSPCVSRICFESKNAPSLICTVDTINCNQMASYPLPQVSEDCFEGRIDIVDETISNVCLNDSIVALMTRSYQATDQFGNLSEVCTSEIYIKSLEMSDVTFPSDTVLSCNLSIAEVNEKTYGLPIYAGDELAVGFTDICGITVSYVDQTLLDTGCKKMINRMWTIYKSKCGKTSTRVQPQIITIEDTLAPVITIADTMLIHTTALSCLGELEINVSQINDACSPLSRVIANGPAATADVLSGQKLSLALGWNEVAIQAFDQCHNPAYDTIQVLVTDNVPPLAICLLNEVVVIDQVDSAATIPVSNLSIDQVDNCGPTTILGRKMNVSCDNTDTTFSDMVTFCCADVGNDVMVLLQVTDSTGNANTCMSIVDVRAHANNVVCSAPLLLPANVINIQGEITDRNGGPMPAVQLMTGSGDNMTYSGKTDFSGVFNIEIPADSEVSLLPYYNESWANGLTTIDALYLQRHLVGHEELSGADAVAADVNGDGLISGVDLVYLRRLILGMIKEVEGHTSWQFVPSHHAHDEYMNVGAMSISESSDMKHADWMGIKTGDILGHTGINNLSGISSRKSVRSTGLYYNVYKVDNDSRVDFYLRDKHAIQGIQGAFHLPDHMRIKSIINGQMAMTSDQYRYDLRSGTLSISQSMTDTLHAQIRKPLFSLLLTGTFIKGEDYITISRDRLLPEIYELKEALLYDLRPDFLDDFDLIIHRNEPNPWSENTEVTFQLPGEGNADIEVFNMDGKLLYSRSGKFEKGINHLTFDKNMINDKGVLIYKITYNDNTVIGKMIKI